MTPKPVRQARRADRAFQDDNEFLRAFLDAVPVPVILSRVSDQVILFANTRAALMFDASGDRLVGARMPDFWVRPAERDAMLALLQREGRVDNVEAEARTSTGRRKWHLISACRFPFRGEETTLVGAFDITQQKAVERKLRELTTHDVLTQAFNRARVFELARQELSRAKRYERPFSVAMLDADHFKRVNDRYGHPVGDRLLRSLARTCRRNLRETDILGRYGGEEFLVLLPETDLEAARGVVERLRLSIAAERIRVKSKTVRYTVSAGVVTMRAKESLASLLERADATMYRAKQRGRNCVVAK